jgi:oligopeptide transport system substrate-binding protein
VTNSSSLRSPVILGLLCLCWSFLVSCSKQPEAPPAPLLRISQRNEPATLDPQLATLPDEFFVIRALSEGLLAPAPGGGAPLPAVAAGWSVSPDGLTYTFELRPEARWSNGDAVTAADFVYSIRRALAPALAAPKVAVFFPLKNAAAYHDGREKDFAAVGVRAVTDHRLELTLAAPAADFPAMVASGPWIPVHRATVEQGGRMDDRGNKWARPGTFVGNGPFTLTTWRTAQEIAVTRNPAYREAAHVALAGIRFLAFDNRDSEELAFRAGQVDVTMDVPFTKIPGYRTAQPPTLRTVPLRETRCIVLNTQHPPLTDPRVRRALSLALDRTALTERVLQGGQMPARSFVPAGLGGYQLLATPEEDAAEARRLLAEAGFPGGRGFPRLELATWTNSPVLEAIQQMWHRELGIEVGLAQREARTHLASLAAGDYTLALWPAIPDYNGASDLFTQLTTGNPANYPHWGNPEFDRLVAEAGRIPDSAGRNVLYHQAEKLLLEEQPLIPLYFNAQNFLVRPGVEHWLTDGLWTRFYQPIELK